MIKRNKWLSDLTRARIDELSGVSSREKIFALLEWLINFLKGKSSIFFIFPLIFFTYVLTYFNFELYNLISITLTKQQAVNLLNGRLSNIVTIFSISLAI